MLPDLALLLVGGNMGVQVMTKEHIAIACALQIPLAVVVTKVRAHFDRPTIYPSLLLSLIYAYIF